MDNKNGNGLFSIPYPTKEPGQRSLDIGDIYLLRNAPTWLRPNQFTAKAWRNLVYSQPIAMVCRQFLIDYLSTLDWKISAVDSTQQDELKGTIKYYTNLLAKGSGDGIDFLILLERVVADMLDIPFGGAAEIGRKGDLPNGRVIWIRPIDGGTLYPTLNMDYPVIQYYAAHNPISFPKHAIARMYTSPRTEIERDGWGMAAPEKIYFALTMIGQGDGYYANLLLDIPPVGILDLMDMSKEDAIEWVGSYKDFLASGGQKSFKIPVLYQHTQDVKFISLGKNPNDIMYDHITLKYAEITCSGYGINLSDIGITPAGGGGRSLAGGIRQDRATRDNGKAIVKRKVANFINSFLPSSVSFGWIDYDDELNVALGRARLANATASGQWIKDGVFGPDEVRRQAIADGLISISLPESLSDAERQKIISMNASGKGSAPERPGAIGTKEPATKGGMGEIVKSIVVNRSSTFGTNVKKVITDVFKTSFPKLINEKASVEEIQPELSRVSTKWLKLSSTPESRVAFKNWIQEYALSRVGEIYQQDFLDEITDDPDIPLDSLEDLEAQMSKIDFDTVYSQFENTLSTIVRGLTLKSIVSALKQAVQGADGVDFGNKGNYTNTVAIVQNSILENLDEIVEQSINLACQETFNSLGLEI